MRLDAAGYTRYRAVANRDDRRLVFREFWKTYGAFTRTLGTTLNAQVEAHIFNKTVRGFDSSLAAALFPDNVPTTVYTQLIADVRANLPTLHRYLKLRKQMMGLDRLGYEDLYAPIIGGSARTFTPEEAQALTLRAVAPLGSEYQEILRGGFESRWVDWMPTTGKRSGAYSTGVYGVHPFQLQNFTGLYDELSTLAHEAGHSMHTFLADRAQPYPTHDYPIFIAEVASTINENLLFHAMLDILRDFGVQPVLPLLVAAAAGAIPLLLLRARDGWLAYAGVLVAVLGTVGLVVYPRIDDVRSGRALMERLEEASADFAELGLASAKEQYLLQLRRPSFNFGHARWREREVEAADAAAWLAQRPGRALLVEKRAREACFSRAEAVDLGRANRQRWFLVWGEPDQACVERGDLTRVRLYLPPDASLDTDS